MEGHDHLYYSTVNIFLMSLNFFFLHSAQLKDASTSPLSISTQKRINNGSKVSKPVTGGRRLGKMSKQKFQDLQRQVNCQMCFCYLSVDIFQRSYVLTKNIKKKKSVLCIFFRLWSTLLLLLLWNFLLAELWELLILPYLTSTSRLFHFICVL